MDPHCRFDKLRGQAIWSLAACNPRSVTENTCGAWAANWGESKSWADGGKADKARALA